MKIGCFVSAACACINKEMSKVVMECTVNAHSRPQDPGEVRRKHVGGFACCRERVDTCVLDYLKTLVAKPGREHSGHTVLLRGEINECSVSGSVNYAISKSMRVLTCTLRALYAS